MVAAPVETTDTRATEIEIFLFLIESRGSLHRVAESDLHSVDSQAVRKTRSLAVTTSLECVPNTVTEVDAVAATFDATT